MGKGRYVDIEKWKRHMHDFLKKHYDNYIQTHQRASKEYAATYFFLKKIAQRKEKERDSVIALTGKKGEGKSSTGIHLGMVLSYMTSVEFDLENSVFYTYDIEEATKKITTTTQKTYLFDEAIDAMSGQDATTRVSKFLSKVFVKSRKLKHTIFLAMPKLWMFSKIFRADLLHFRLEHVLRTKNFALVALMAPDQNPDNPDPWFLDWKSRKYMRRPTLYSKRQVIGIMQRDPNFVAWLKVPPLPKKIEELYLETSMRALARMSERAKQL